MKRLILFLFLLLCTFFAIGASYVALYHETKYTIYTGTKNGTFYAIGQDIARACPKLNVNVEATEGTLQNIASVIKVRQGEGYRLGFAQSDILDFALAFAGDKRDNLYSLAWPFYNAEINVVVNKKSNINSVLDLAGKKVAGGANGTGAWHTASNLEHDLGIKWVSVFAPPTESVDLLLKGEIDAMVVIGGAPMSYLKDIDPTANEKIKLLSINKPDLPMYSDSIIPGGTYKWEPRDIKTKAIRSLMIASKDVPEAGLNEIRKCVADNLPQIKQVGHKKWRDITAAQILGLKE